MNIHEKNQRDRRQIDCAAGDSGIAKYDRPGDKGGIRPYLARQFLFFVPYIRVVKYELTVDHKQAHILEFSFLSDFRFGFGRTLYFSGASECKFVFIPRWVTDG